MPHENFGRHGFFYEMYSDGRFVGSGGQYSDSMKAFEAATRRADILVWR